MTFGPRPRAIARAAAKFAFAAIFVVAGVGHFVATAAFERLMPPWLPAHRALVLISGVFEVALGVLLLVPKASRLAAWGLIALLIAVFPANVHVYFHQELLPAPAFVHFLRLPAQGLLIWWAWVYTKRAGRPGTEETSGRPYPVA